MKVEVVVLDFQSLISHIVSVEVKQKLNSRVEECLKPVPAYLSSCALMMLATS